MSGSFTDTAQKHDYFGSEERGANFVHFSRSEKLIAQEHLWECQEKIDKLWNAMFDAIQDETGRDSADVYLLIQRVQYQGKPKRKSKR